MPVRRPVAAILLAALLAGAVLAARQMRPAAHAGESVGQRIKGSRNAKLNVIEFFDYQCGACRTAYQLFEEYERAFPGTVRIEMRYFPLPGHPHGRLAAVYAECASSQGKFWPFHDRIMGHQPEWSPMPDPSAVFRGYAVESGVDEKMYDACTADPQTEIQIVREKEAAMAMGIKMTPTCLMNGEMVVGSNAVAEALKKMFGSLEKSS